MSTPILYRFEAARSVVRDAAALAMKMRPAPGGPQATQKAAQDWLTETDGAVEALISQRIGEMFPEDGFQGEEEGRTRTGSLRWVVDPIDGTSNYARGRNRWCISLGLMDGDTPIAGIIEAPALGGNLYRDTWPWGIPERAAYPCFPRIGHRQFPDRDGMEQPRRARCVPAED